MQSYVFRAGSTLANRDLKGNNSFSIVEINLITRQIIKNPIYYDTELNEWKDLNSITLDFPQQANEKVVNHKVHINQYFTNLKEFILSQEELYSEKYIPAQEFLNEAFSGSSLRTICDLGSLKNADTLTEYMAKHSEIRTRVLIKIAKTGNSFVFVEPLELYKT